MAIDIPWTTHMERSVRRATHDRVADLRIETSSDGGLVIKGYCPTSYCKKMAQDVVSELAGQAKLLNEIEVGVMRYVNAEADLQ